MFSWFAFFRDTAPLPPLDAATLYGIASMLRDVPDLREGIVLSPTPTPTAHPFPDNEPAPALVLQLRFDTIEALEAAAALPMRHLADVHRHKWLNGRNVTHQAMLTRRYNVPDAHVNTPPGTLPCSYLVTYPGPAADINAWNAHYNAHHPPIMARFPGVRAIEIYTRIDWVSGLDWPRENAMQRNKLLFDSPEALTAALLSPVLQDMRADFHLFPPFEGGNVHYVLQSRLIGPHR